MTPVWLLAFVLTAPPNAQLASAEDLVAQVRYSDAEKALTLARAQQGNPRETVLRILELQGIVAATLGQAPKAKTYFQQLLSLAPERKLPEGLPPRVRTPFYEAKGMASEARPMNFTATVDAEGVRAKLAADPMTLARKARFHLKEGEAWTITDKPIAAGFAVVTPKGAQYAWWVELLGEQDATLFSIGSEETPRVEGASPGGEKEVPIVEAPHPSSPPSKVNPAAFVFIGVGAAAAVGGIVCGVLSSGNLSKVTSATRDMSGAVTGLTQKQAAGLQADARTEAIAANVLIGAGVALAATGVVIWIVSGTSSKVAVIPSPGGIVAAGEF